MARQARGRLLPKHGQPAGSERAEIEIAKLRDLDIERVPVQRDRDDFDARHADQAARRRDEGTLAATG